jgi:tripartite ATP-independent transporter DctM subunit
MGGLLLPGLLKEKYPEKFSLGLLTTSGSLGLLFPPSLPLILYGIVSKTNVEKLFLAGLLPGTLMLVFLALFSARSGIAAKVPRNTFSWREMRKVLKDSIWELPLPFVVLGGIYGGFVAVSEVAAITALYVLVVETMINREVSWKGLFKAMRECMILVGAVLIVLGAALAFTNYLIDAEIPMKVLAFFRHHITDRLVFLIMLNLFLLIVGCVLDIFSALVVVVPLIVPMAEAYGVNLIHLGIIFLTNLQIGYSTPPVGMNLFIASLRFERPVAVLYTASLPFLSILLLVLLLITYFPQLSLFLPGLR